MPLEKKWEQRILAFNAGFWSVFALVFLPGYDVRTERFSYRCPPVFRFLPTIRYDSRDIRKKQFEENYLKPKVTAAIGSAYSEAFTEYEKQHPEDIDIVVPYRLRSVDVLADVTLRGEQRQLETEKNN